MAACFGTLPRISTVKRLLACALVFASGKFKYQAAWLRASVRFRQAQLLSGMAARFNTLPRSSTFKRRGCAFQSASEELNSAALLHASIRFRVAQLSSGTSARFGTPPRSSTVKRCRCALQYSSVEPNCRTAWLHAW
eukprot:1919850-Heterocapsa_arctica.AAC.1